MFAAVAAVAFVATCAAGALSTHSQGSPKEQTKGAATTAPEPPTTAAPPTTEEQCRPAPPPPSVSDGTGTTTSAPSGKQELMCQSDFPPPAGERTPPDPATAPPADAPLTERIEFAYRVAYLSKIEHAVLSDSRYGGMSYETWTDDRTGTMRSASTGMGGSLAGKPALDGGPASFDGNRPVGHRDLDYCFSQYTESPVYGPTNNVTAPIGLKIGIDTGKLVIDGNDTVDGRAAIRLHHTDHDETIWLDASTLLPFKSSGSYGHDGGFVTTFEFLDRTPENQALLVPPIPEGFHKVDKLQGDGASHDAGCWDA